MLVLCPINACPVKRVLCGNHNLESMKQNIQMQNLTSALTVANLLDQRNNAESILEIILEIILQKRILNVHIVRSSLEICQILEST